MGSDDPLDFFERAYLFRRGQVEHILTVANLKLKSSLFTPALTTKALFSDSASTLVEVKQKLPIQSLSQLPAAKYICSTM